MAQTGPLWRHNRTWAELVARYGVPQQDVGVQSVEADEAVAVVEAADVGEDVPRQGWRIAELRRAIILAEVLGPPRALRGGGMRR